MSSFLERINYSSVNEDATSEIAALQPTPADRCLCITGSGARPLDLLIQPVGEIVAIDMNPCQNYLLALKIAAIRTLSYGDFCAFIGLTSSADRLSTYTEVRSCLPPDARRYWDSHRHSIREGVLYQGTWERHFKTLAQFVAATRGPLVDRLFAASSPAEQGDLWDREWNTLPWKLFLRASSSRLNWKFILRDPGFYRYVPDEVSIAHYFDTRLRNAAHRIPFHTSPFATLLFTGSLNQHGALPLHLQEEHYPTLQANIERLTTLTAPLDSIPEGDARARFDAFSISDVSSYTDQRSYERIWSAITAMANPGTRICERQFLVKRDIPEPRSRIICRNHALESTLEATDTSFFYSFICARIPE